MYIQLIGRMLAEPKVAADTMPPLASPPLPNALGRNGATWRAWRRPAAPIITMYIQLVGRMLAEPKVAADTMPPSASPPLPNALGRNGARCDLTAHGPTPGPPPRCGMQNVLCRLRCDTSEPH